MTLIDKINEDLKNMLDEKRYLHTLGVVNSAIQLCSIYNCDVEKAKIASLLHDIAKQMSEDKSSQLIDKYNIQLDELEKSKMQLLDSKLATAIAKYEYNIQDIDILNAVSYHTTGRDNMTKLEMIVCLADYIEENRTFKGVDKIRELSKINLEYALYYALNKTIIHLAENNEQIHLNSIKARNFLLEKSKNYIKK